MYARYDRAKFINKNMQKAIMNLSRLACSCNVLRDLVPFVQIKIREKKSWRSVTFIKVANKKPATLLKVTLLHGCLLHFLNFINGTKSRNALQL